jgi:hypothetical protein
MSASILVRGFGLGYVALISIMNNSRNSDYGANVFLSGSVPEIINPTMAVSLPPPGGPADY